MRRILLVLMFLALSALPAFAQFDFPNSPTANEIIAGPAGQALKWDGTKWVAQFGSVGGPFLPEAPLDGNSYLRTNGAWTSGGTLANDLTVSAVHLTNLTGWAPLNFGQPSLTAGTDGAVVASLFAYNRGVGGNNNLNITAGAYMWNGNWVSATPTAEAIVMNPTSISLQYSTGNTVGAGLGTWRTVGVFDSTGLTLTSGALGIGAVAPTAAGSLGQFTATGNWNADIQITNADATDTQAYATYYLHNGTHYGAMQLAGMGATFNGPTADNLSIQTNAANGINLVTNAATANISFFVNTLANEPLIVEPGGLRLGGTGASGPYINFQPNGQANSWAMLSSGATSNLNVSAGGHFNGSTWIADNATYHDMSLQSVGGSTGFNFYENSGLTVGAAFTPAQIGQWGVQGGWNNGLHLGMSAQQVYSCYNSFPNIANGGGVDILHTGVWGASAAGLLTVYNTYSGAVTMALFGISSFGSPAGNAWSQIITNDYGGGGAHFTVTQAGATDGGGNPYARIIVTNTSGQTASIYYWYTQTGGGSTMYCQ